MPNKKNKGKVPKMHDKRVEFVPIGCGKCMECMKKKAMNWQVRLHEELRCMENNLQETGEYTDVYFIRLSYSDKSLIHLENEIHRIKKIQTTQINRTLKKKIKFKPYGGYYLDNKIAKLSVRRFLERWRKENKKSVKHWLITELGKNNTERLHLHGFIFTTKPKEDIKKHWKYGDVWIGKYVNERSVNYMVKYVHKTDPKHKYYNPIILCSPGIGSGYLNRHDSKLNRFNDKDTNELYRTRDRTKLSLPIYYRNKLYSEEEKEKLWLNILDTETRYVDRIKIDVSKGEDDYNKVVKFKRIESKQLGYNSDEENYNEKKYEQQLRNLKKIQRHNKERKRNDRSS